jgi:hypothetical protein
MDQMNAAQLQVVRDLVIELAVAMVLDDEELITDAMDGLGHVLHITQGEADAALRAARTRRGEITGRVHNRPAARPN